MRWTRSMLSLIVALFAVAVAARDPAAADEAVKVRQSAAQTERFDDRYDPAPWHQNYGGYAHGDYSGGGVEFIQGPQGTTGPQGVIGGRGATGAIGTTGVRGATGVQGSTGSTGPQGTTGTQGTQGVTGAVGAAGICAPGSPYVIRSSTTGSTTNCQAANPGDTGSKCVIATCATGGTFVSGGCSNSDGNGKASAPLCYDASNSPMVCPSKQAKIVGWACSADTTPLTAEAVCCGEGVCVPDFQGPNTCSEDEQCCSGSACGALDKQCCKALTTPCTIDTQCCSGKCTIGTPSPKCCIPGTGAGTQGTCTADQQCCTGLCTVNTGRCRLPPPCLSGQTTVRTLEHPTPIPIEDLKTGDHVQCANTNVDMRLPTTMKYCEVMNWLHARPDTVHHRRISFARPDGAPGSLTLSPTHFMLRLAEPKATAGRRASSADAFGKLEHVLAEDIKPGDQLVVMVDAMTPEAGWVAVAVTGVEAVQADGMYVPALESPYIIADGVITPLYVGFHNFNAATDGPEGADIAVVHYQHAPAFMQRLTPVGVAGKDAAALGASLNKAIEEGKGIGAAWRYKVYSHRRSLGQVLSFTAVRDWFLPRLAAWRADPTKVVTLQDVAAVMASDSSWVKVSPGQRKSSGVVAVE